MIDVIAAVWPWDRLMEPWTIGPVRLAVEETTLLGIAGGALGCWVVLFDLSYGAESLSHGLFPGLVVAALAGLSLTAGAAGGVILAALVIAAVMRAPLTSRQTAVAVAVTTLMGLGALLALSPAAPPGIQELLFGDVLAVTPADLLLSAAVALVTLGALAPMHDRLLLTGFDRPHAPAFGVNPVRVEFGLLLLLAAVIVVAAQAVGALLAPAIVIGPAATARLVTRRVRPMMILSVGLAVSGGILGLYTSYYASTAAGASVAGVMVVVYVAVDVATRRHRRPGSVSAAAGSGE